MNRERLIYNILGVSATSFDQVALEVFHYQANNNPLYEKYLRLLSINPKSITKVENIPFLPIQFYKSYSIQTGVWEPNIIFESSGTTGTTTSKHLVKDPDFYHLISQKGFEQHYGPLKEFCFLALLPSYLERSNSSLVDMVNYFIQQSKYKESGFFLSNLAELVEKLKVIKEKETPCVLVGVSFALLDLAEQFKLDLGHVIVMETGGMKGRRKEITRKQLHEQLKAGLGVDTIHSEYGMTELLSQAYSKGKGVFTTSNTMKILIREITDPFAYRSLGLSGGVNIIDLANIDSCSFIATDDIGRLLKNDTFEILGRIDSSDIRGCNLLVF